MTGCCAGTLARREGRAICSAVEERFRQLILSTVQLPDEILEKRQPQFYHHLSCIFVKILDVSYGTRTHSIVLVDYDWNVEFHEVTMEEPIDPEHPVWKTNVIRDKL